MEDVIIKYEDKDFDTVSVEKFSELYIVTYTIENKRFILKEVPSNGQIRNIIYKLKQEFKKYISDKTFEIVFIYPGNDPENEKAMNLNKTLKDYNIKDKSEMSILVLSIYSNDYVVDMEKYLLDKNVNFLNYVTIKFPYRSSTSEFIRTFDCYYVRIGMDYDSLIKSIKDKIIYDLFITEDAIYDFTIKYGEQTNIDSVSDFIKNFNTNSVLLDNKGTVKKEDDKKLFYINIYFKN